MSNVKRYIDTVSILAEAIQPSQGKRYLLLAEKLTELIQSRKISGKLPTHRWLADQLNTTPGTVSRAYQEVTKLGLIHSRIGDGTYVVDLNQQKTFNKEFRHVLSESNSYFDMSRNIHIPMKSNDFLCSSLSVLSDKKLLVSSLNQYAPESGMSEHRKAGAAWMSSGDFQPRWERIICTNGGQHGLLCTLIGLFKRGDCIATDRFTYPGLISLSKQLGIRLLPIALDENGMIPESLDELCSKHRVKALYCMTSIHNPTNTVLPIDRTKRLAQLCEKHNLIIIEDHSHVLVNATPPLATYCADRTIVISGLSKSGSASLRVGYLYTPTAFHTRLLNAVRSTCWMATPLMHELACHWINSGMLEEIVQEQVHEIARRQNMVIPCLEGTEYTRHPLSPHFWIYVSGQWRATEIKKELEHQNFLISTAEDFAVGRQSIPQYLRVSVSTEVEDDELLVKGFEAIALAIKS